MKSSTHFSLVIYTKPYLKKYLHSLYGNPLIFDKDNLFGVTVAAFLDKPLDFHVTKEELRCRTDKYTEKMEVFLPKTILTKRRSLGYDLTDQHTITLNKFFETRFTLPDTEYIVLTEYPNCRALSTIASRQSSFVDIM